MFIHIPVNIAYPWVKNDGDVCEKIESLQCKVKNEILLHQIKFRNLIRYIIFS
jgi:hypothetical protein